MGIYVDPLMSCIPSASWRYSQSCHLVADTLEELHDFARKLGLKRSWFQSKKGSVPHYDLSPRRRELAVRLGAEEITRKTMVVKFIRAAREAAKLSSGNSKGEHGKPGMEIYNKRIN